MGRNCSARSIGHGRRCSSSKRKVGRRNLRTLPVQAAAPQVRPTAGRLHIAERALPALTAAASRARVRATYWECTRARVGGGWEALIAGIDTMQSRCSTSSTLTSRPLPSLDPPRHTCRWTSPSTATAGRGSVPPRSIARSGLCK
eukprot:scaffold137238_cov142-Phaeocystis_antarctica.AAC.1